MLTDGKNKRYWKQSYKRNTIKLPELINPGCVLSNPLNTTVTNYNRNKIKTNKQTQQQ